MVAKKNICVIGAGVSGLVAAKTFKEKGHAVTVVERSHDLGGVWELSRSYPEVQTQSPGELYAYSDMPMPDEYPEWPKGPQVHAYLTKYAQTNQILELIRFNTEVVSIIRSNQKPGWDIKLKNNSQTHDEHYDFVVVCTGQFSDKKTLKIPGSEDFKQNGGQIMHSSEYSDRSNVKGKKTVVLGFSKSATDIAVNLVHSGASNVHIVYREPVWRIPYFFGNVLNFKNILYCRAAESMFKPWNASFLGSLLHALFYPLIWANWRALESLLKIQFKLKKLKMIPSGNIESEINCSLPIETPGLYKLMNQGQIKPSQGTIAKCNQGGVILDNGKEIQADIVILAIGWNLAIPCIGHELESKMLEDDGQYRLYHTLVNPDIPNMGFVGYNSSFATPLCAEIGSNWLVRYFDQKLAKQPTAQMMNNEIDRMLRWRRNKRPAAKVYGGLCVAPYHYRHLDILMKDMGAKAHRANPIANLFAPISPKIYKYLLKTAPSYRVE